MKTQKLTAEEIQAAEMSVEERKQSRKQGFTKMFERDKVMHRLSNGVQILWHVDPSLVKCPPGGVWPNIPEDQFMLVIDGKEHYFNTQEFKRWVRWA